MDLGIGFGDGLFKRGCDRGGYLLSAGFVVDSGSWEWVLMRRLGGPAVRTVMRLLLIQIVIFTRPLLRLMGLLRDMIL